MVERSGSMPNLLPVTKDFGRDVAGAYINKYITPYVTDRVNDYAFNPLFVPQKDNLDFKWRRVNREPFLMKKYGKFPRSSKELTIEDVRSQMDTTNSRTCSKDSFSMDALHKAVGSSADPNCPLHGDHRGVKFDGYGKKELMSAEAKIALTGESFFPLSQTPMDTPTHKELTELNNQPRNHATKAFSSTAKKTPSLIFEEKGRLTTKDELGNFDLAKLQLKEDTLYVPPHSNFQGPHPLSETRQNFHDDPTVDMKEVMKLRKLGGAVIPTSRSLTNVPLAPDKERACEFRSALMMQKSRKKHIRSMQDPYSKFSGAHSLASQAIGWSLADPRAEVRYGKPKYGIKEMAEQKYYHNMKMTNMEAILRYNASG